MKIGKGFWLFVAGIVIGGIIGFYSFIFLKFFVPHSEPLPPKIAGVRVPTKTYDIDFSKRYDLTLDSRYGPEKLVNCLIKGFTRGKTESSSSSRYEYFDTWLVVEQPDGRTIYFPPRNIMMIEESKS